MKISEALNVVALSVSGDFVFKTIQWVLFALTVINIFSFFSVPNLSVL